MKTQDIKLDKYKTFFNKGKEAGRKEVIEELREILNKEGVLKLVNRLRFKLEEKQ